MIGYLIAECSIFLSSDLIYSLFLIKNISAFLFENGFLVCDWIPLFSKTDLTEFNNNPPASKLLLDSSISINFWRTNSISHLFNNSSTSIEYASTKYLITENLDSLFRSLSEISPIKNLRQYNRTSSRFGRRCSNPGISEANLFTAIFSENGFPNWLESENSSFKIKFKLTNCFFRVSE